MSVQMTTRNVGDVVVIDISGHITAGVGSVRLEQLVSHILKDKKNKIVLNLADTAYVDSSGLHQIVSSFMRLKRQGGGLKLLAISERMKSLLEITKLLMVFDVYDNEELAVQSFTQSK